ncbi:hypothetical protein, partial [Paenibacillus odorifer]|uniref:hypothetical protein n=1 Tax=Paenibacillus odorifer TaxID=189426 RepID=UPI000BD67A63
VRGFESHSLRSELHKKSFHSGSSFLLSEFIFRLLYAILRNGEFNILEGEWSGGIECLFDKCEEFKGGA